MALRERIPEARLVFSAITTSGYGIAKERFASYSEGNVFYFPIDLGIIVGRVFSWIKPTMLVTIDTEIWPNTLREASRRGVPVIMVNGRISAESFRWYIKVRHWLKPILDHYAVLLTKSDEDSERLIRLGAPQNRIKTIGSIKFDRGPAEAEMIAVKAAALDDAFGLTASTDPLIVAGSTHDGEEEVLLDVLHDIRSNPLFQSARLLIAPRRPERFDPVVALAQRKGFVVKRRSTPMAGDQDAQVLVLDVVGELAAAYKFATIAFVGGTLIPHGGQSIMEPAAWGKPIVVGPSMLNFPQTIDEFRSRSAIIQTEATHRDKKSQRLQLAKAIVGLLADDGERSRIGDTAYDIFKSSQGSADQAVDIIEALYRAH